MNPEAVWRAIKEQRPDLQKKAMDTRRKIHDVAKDVITGTLNP